MAACPPFSQVGLSYLLLVLLAPLRAPCLDSSMAIDAISALKVPTELDPVLARFDSWSVFDTLAFAGRKALSLILCLSLSLSISWR